MMSPSPAGPGRVAVLGCGPAGMAAALSLAQSGHRVTLYERYPEARPAGNVLNLWPPPIKALGALGVDLHNFGAPCEAEFCDHKGRRRALIKIPAGTGGFLGMLRPELYERLFAALPPGILQVNREVVRFTQDERKVTLHFKDGSVEEADVLIGADGLHSVVRRTLWNDPVREHRLHVIAGHTFADDTGAIGGKCVLMHSRAVQGSWTAIRHQGRYGFQWWLLEACDPAAPAPEDLHAKARAMAQEFAAPLPRLVESTDPARLQHWVLRDRRPLRQWSKGRVTLVGDAAHPTSPYAAYGAGMAIEDGYFLGRALAGCDLSDPARVTGALRAYETPRVRYTARQSQTAYYCGRLFHHTPRVLRPLRDLVLDHTPFLQKVVGDSNPKVILSQLALIEDTPPALPS
ncbi:NAD(P)/FAD-dependent oxidoreductase [Streptomyces sp. Li-HN-5-11]|uniref:FAD-dependent oxidoreductase n=1 Tax=Streptomyces sp. Li-HN-5-11 TaxID=3075432 RepID=UPI0028A7B1F1|nr:NAD(P)/FAD-dependent oxidoreductase [Streptomyces sp. Li-HN-5-11]WNM31668.1 NAD(P)/FAD-dependent oxidoreductase [Streptomyces sp. Li-HN-5-11]